MERIWKLPLCHCFWIMLIQYTHRWKVRVMQFEAEDRSTWYCLVRSGCTGYSLIGWRGYTGPGGLHQLHRHGWSRAPPHGGTVRLIHLLLLVKLHREMGQLENVGKSVKESSLARFTLIRKLLLANGTSSVTQIDSNLSFGRLIFQMSKLMGLL